MSRYNSISVVPARSLQVGDLVAYKFLDAVTAGRITGIAYCSHDLTEDQKQYLISQNIELPKSEWESIGGNGYVLLLGEFHDGSAHIHEHKHMFVSMDTNFAVL